LIPSKASTNDKAVVLWHRFISVTVWHQICDTIPQSFIIPSAFTGKCDSKKNKEKQMSVGITVIGQSVIYVKTALLINRLTLLVSDRCY
jgi:hypothetical protein